MASAKFVIIFVHRQNPSRQGEILPSGVGRIASLVDAVPLVGHLEQLLRARADSMHGMQSAHEGYIGAAHPNEKICDRFVVCRKVFDSPALVRARNSIVKAQNFVPRQKLWIKRLGVCACK